jgi:hypothetical protein
LNYAESARKRACTSEEEDGFPTPDYDLGDYISTFFENGDSPPIPVVNPGTTMSPPCQERQQDMLELAMDSWASLYTGSVTDEYQSIAAVAAPPANAQPTIALQVAPSMVDRRLGTVRLLLSQWSNRTVG